MFFLKYLFPFFLITRHSAFDLFKLKKNQFISPVNIISIKDKNTYYDINREQFYKNNENVKNKKLITVSPGGYRGFYMFGVCKYIKENYDLDNYIFSGASAGAWLSLFLCFKKNINEIEENLVDMNFQNTESIYEMQCTVKYNLLSKYTSDDFDLNNLFIGVTCMNSYNYITPTIYYNFDDLEDAIDCCIASSHIPMITGGLYNIYKNKISFDGGFCKYPYLNILEPTIHITPFLWEKESYSNIDIKKYTSLFSKGEYNFVELIEKGYYDTLENKDYIDTFLQSGL